MQLRSPYDRDIARLAIPALGTLVAEPLYLLADTAFVGHIGTPELAGLALATTILLTLHAVLIFLAYGTTGPVARLISSGQDQQAAHRSLQAIWLAALLGVAVAGVLLAAGSPLLELISGQDPTGEILDAGKKYLFISLIGFPFSTMTLAANGCFHGRQDTRTPLALAVFGALANLAIEFVLIRLLGYGVGASALSTVAVQMAVGITAVWFVISWSLQQGAGRWPDTRSMVALLQSGKPLLVRGVCLRGSFSIAAIIAVSMGAVEGAAHQIVIGLWSTLTLALDAVAIAGQALTGKWLGLDDHEQARSATRRMVEIDFAVGIAMGLAVLVARGPLSELFTDDQQVSQIAATLLVYLAIQQPVNGIVFALDGILIGAGDYDYLARSMVGVSVVFGAFAGLVVLTDAGITWLWVAIGGLMVTRLGTLVHRWRAEQWLSLAS